MDWTLLSTDTPQLLYWHRENLENVKKQHPWYKLHRLPWIVDRTRINPCQRGEHLSDNLWHFFFNWWLLACRLFGIALCWVTVICAGKVLRKCQGNPLCSVSATNEVFGDPCPGTHKYLEVNYVCEAWLGGCLVAFLSQEKYAFNVK